MINYIVSLFDIDNIAKYHEAKATSVVAGYEHASYRSVKDFSEEELRKIKSECNQYQMNLYVLMNRFYHDDALDLLQKQLQFLKEIDVDGIYFTDEAVLYYAQQLQMVHKLIYLPDTLLCNHLDCNYYLNEGMQMVAISKEITKEEICMIADQVKDIEVIIHGRVVMMHSKRKLLSAYQEFVKLPHELRNRKDLVITEENRDARMPIYEDEFGTHVFSGYTLASFEEIREFYDHGVRNFKIDGIFHDVDWVIEALTLYQEVLNGKDGKQVYEQYQTQHENDAVSKGFYLQKTSKVKEN